MKRYVLFVSICDEIIFLLLVFSTDGICYINTYSAFQWDFFTVHFWISFLLDFFLQDSGENFFCCCCCCFCFVEFGWSNGIFNVNRVTKGTFGGGLLGSMETRFLFFSSNFNALCKYKWKMCDFAKIKAKKLEHQQVGFPLLQKINFISIRSFHLNRFSLVDRLVVCHVLFCVYINFSIFFVFSFLPRTIFGLFFFVLLHCYVSIQFFDLLANIVHVWDSIFNWWVLQIQAARSINNCADTDVNLQISFLFVSYFALMTVMVMMMMVVLESQSYVGMHVALECTHGQMFPIPSNTVHSIAWSKLNK